MRWSDGSYLEDQDHWWLSGIHRDVLLLAKPEVRTSIIFWHIHVQFELTDFFCMVAKTYLVKIVYGIRL